MSSSDAYESMESESIMTGKLYKYTNQILFKSWVKKTIELRGDVLLYYGGKASLSSDKGVIHLGSNITFEDSSLRHFCFCLKDTSNNESYFFAAENISEKQRWTDKIRLVLLQSHGSNNVTRNRNGSDKKTFDDYHNRPMLYLRIIKAKNLVEKDSNSSLEPYVTIMVGSSTVKTLKSFKSNTPEWGMVFHFDIENANRFAKVELWNKDNTSSDGDFLGLVYIPLLPLRAGYTQSSWYPLCKKSQKGTVRGEIEIEITLTGDTDPDHFAWHFFRHVQVLPSIQMNLLQNHSPSIDYAASNHGFPFNFPPIETEIFEDFSIRIQLQCITYTSRVSTRGVLILTNYRLIFVSLSNILNASDINSSNVKQFMDHGAMELTMQIPIGSIASLSLGTETDGSNNNATVYEILKVRTLDQRTVGFILRDDFDYYNATQIQERAKKILSESFGKDSPDRSDDMFPSATTSLESAWLNLISNPDNVIDRSDSAEGSSLTRIYNRLNIKVINRVNEQQYLLTIHKELIEVIVNQSLNLTSKDSSEVVTTPDDIPVNDDLLTDLEIAENDATVDAYKSRVSKIPSDICKAINLHMKSGWHIYNIYEEFARMGIPDPLWRISTANYNFELCSTYPKLLVVPAIVDDQSLFNAAQFRSKARIPVLSWRNMTNNCTITRCSQPLVGLKQNRSAADEFLIDSINRCGGITARDALLNAKSQNSYKNPLVQSGTRDRAPSSADKSLNRSSSSANLPTNTNLPVVLGPTKPLIIMDARPLLNATANQAAGKGFESERNYENTSVMFMDIANIHAVRKSLEQLEDACGDENHWLRNLDASGWFTHLLKILRAAVKIVHSLAYEDRSVLIHCSDGWDRTAQLSSLSMLMLDPFYRTIRGFLILIEKEWMSFGHKFSDRLGWTKHGLKDDERSPIFQLFLECTFQCMQQSPQAFEFNENLLLFIMEHMFSGWFGNFLFNCDRERDGNYSDEVSNNIDPSSRNLSNSRNTLCLWTTILNAPKEQFHNNNFIPMNGVVIPVTTKHRMIVWNKWYLRWHEKVWLISWLQENQFHENDNRDINNHIIQSNLDSNETFISSSGSSQQQWLDFIRFYFIFELLNIYIIYL